MVDTIHTTLQDALDGESNYMQYSQNAQRGIVFFRNAVYRKNNDPDFNSRN